MGRVYVTWERKIYKDGEYKKSIKKNITKYVNKIVWSGASTQASRQLEVSIINAPYDKNIRVPKIRPGDLLKLFRKGHKDPLFIGRVPNKQKTSEVGTIELVAYDYMHDLIGSTMTKKFRKKTPEYITKAVLADMGVAAGEIMETKTTIKRYFPDQMSPYDIIVGAYQKVADRTGKKYFFRMKGAKFEVIERGKMTEKVLTENLNLTASNYEENADGVVNKVEVYRGNKKVNSVQNDKSINRYGIKQQTISVEKGKGKKEAEATLQGMEKSASISALGFFNCVSGRGVAVKDTASGLTGKFWIKNDTHTFENGHHLMDLDLDFKNIMEEVEIKQLPKKKKKQESGTTTGSSSDQYVYTYEAREATFTAYNPTGRPTANGETTDPSAHTCAAGTMLEFNTLFTVDGTGTDQDGIEYRVNDRPLFDTVGGRIHIDLLMADHGEAINFGTRYGNILIKHEIPNPEYINPQVTELIEYAKSFIGTPYVWGGKDPHSGADCSGFVGYVYQHFGIPVRQFTGYMESDGYEINPDERRAGDMILFQGTYAADNCTATHVGIMVDRDNYIESNSTCGVTISPYNSAWCMQYFYQIRRVM